MFSSTRDDVRLIIDADLEIHPLAKVFLRISIGKKIV
jgi:hypothetical protein